MVQHVPDEFYKCFSRRLIKRVSEIYICYWPARYMSLAGWEVRDFENAAQGGLRQHLED